MKKKVSKPLQLQKGIRKKLSAEERPPMLRPVRFDNKKKKESARKRDRY